MTAPWSFRCLWPVEDEALGYKTAVGIAEAELEERAADAGARLVGPVEWSMVEHDQPDEWPHTALALVAVADAVPARPSRTQFPALIRWYVDQGMTDPQIGEQLGLSKAGVLRVRKIHGIPPGVPPGYRSRSQIGQPP